MYGIFINRQATPYLLAGDPYIAVRTAKINRDRGYHVTLEVQDPPCEWCEEEAPGWYPVDEVPLEDLIPGAAHSPLLPSEPVLHDACRGVYVDQQQASHYV